MSTSDSPHAAESAEPHVPRALGFPAPDQATLILDSGGIVREANAAAMRHLERDRSELIGRPAKELLDGRAQEAVLVLLAPIDTGTGAGERLQRRTAFLAEAGLVLDRSLDLEETLRGLAALTVPGLAHLAVIDVLHEDGSVRWAVAAGEDPEQARALEQVRAAHPLQRTSPHPVVEVLRSGRSVLLPAMEPEYLRTIAQGTEHLRLMRRLHYRSAIVVPLVARQRVLGALSLLNMQGEREYDAEDLVLAEELARRAAYAVDNARLFEATRRLARTLQDSLLPRALPEIPGVEVSTRYVAAQEGQVVGGDFYDVFTVAGDRWGIAIGDVCGKGAEAAALTALARHTIRAVAGAGADAGTVLRLLGDAVIRDSPAGEPRFLTALVAIAELAADGLSLEIAAAGHPPPLVRHADGSVEAIPVRGALAGFMPAVPYAASTVALRAGETMLFYTDGLTDARAPEPVLSELDLATILTAAGGLRGADLLRFLHQRATGGAEPRDDIAILALDVGGTVAGYGASRSIRQPETVPLSGV